MSIDLSKLTAAPWIASDSRHEPDDWSVDGKLDLPPGKVGWMIQGGSPWEPQEGWAVVSGEDGNGSIIPERTDLEFIALARNAFEVMARTGWHPVPVERTDGRQWKLCDQCQFDLPLVTNRFASLVAAWEALVERYRQSGGTGI
jgi:hypothetical protein